MAGIGLLASFVYRRGKKEFRWSNYALFIAGPLGTVIIYAFAFGYYYFLVFFVGIVFSEIFELSWGFLYHKCMGKRLWSYAEAPLLGGYVSGLTPPFWGFATVLFFRVIEILGII